MRQKITIPLPPSVNVMYQYNRYSHQKIYKQEVRDYYEYNTLILQNWVKLHHVKPVEEMTHFDMEFFLSSKNADATNYLKISMDLLEKAGIVSNDKFVMARIQKVDYDKENPRIIISWLSPA